MTEDARIKSTHLTNKRFNLLAFPTETNALFALLVMAAVMLAVQLSFYIYLFLFPNRTLMLGANLNDLIRGEVFAQTMLNMVIGLSVPTLLIGLILGVAFFIYRDHPRRVRRRKKLEPLTETDKPIQKAITDMAAQAGISPPFPVVEMPRGYKGTSGQAFGFRKKYFIRLDGGLRIWRRIKSGRFRAIVLHELAHITNGDVWHSYLAEALWKAMLVLSVLPLLLGISLKIISGVFGILLYTGVSEAISSFLNVLPLIVGLIFQTILMLGIIATIRARLLRSREVYADWQASVWGAQDALQDIFQESSENEKSKSSYNLFRLHPTADERLGALSQPNQLIRLSWFLAFLVGYLIALVLGGMFLLVPRFYVLILEPIRLMRLGLTTGSLLYWAARGLWFTTFFGLILIVFLPLGWLVSGVLGPQLQKQITANLIEGKRGFEEYFKLGIPAISLGIGIEVGFWATPLGLFTPKTFAGFAVDFLMIAVVIALTWVFLTYARFINIGLLAAHTGPMRSTWQTLLGRWALNIWVFLFFIPGLIFGRLLIWNASDADYFVPFLIGFGIWLVLALVFGSLTFALSWGAIKLFSTISPARCSNCGRTTRRDIPAIETCEHCGEILGKWLYVFEENKI